MFELTANKGQTYLKLTLEGLEKWLARYNGNPRRWGVSYEVRICK